MSIITGVSELSAVNRMLLGIGQTPVNTLEVAGIRDVNIARLTLEQVSFELQAAGHRFNTFEMALTPRIEDNRILLPADVISVQGIDGDDNLSVEIDLDAPEIRYLLDRRENTDVFLAPVRVMAARFLPWATLPGHVSAYFAAEAAARFQEQQVGSPSLAAPLERSRQRAYADFRKQELRQSRANAIYDAARLTGRSLTYSQHRSQRHA
jgi:hypothetical protein